MGTLEKRLAQEVDFTPMLHMEIHDDDTTDLSFGSTVNPPQVVLDILAKNTITFSPGDKIVHIPGSRFFGFVHHFIDDVTHTEKTDYLSFSLDPGAYDIEETPVEQPQSRVTSEPVIEKAASVQSVASESESIKPTVSENSFMENPFSVNTLGTIPSVVENQNNVESQEVVPPQKSESLPVQPVVVSNTASVNEAAPVVIETTVSENISKPEPAEDVSTLKKLGLTLPSHADISAKRVQKIFGGIAGTPPARKVEIHPNDRIISLPPQPKAPPFIPVGSPRVSEQPLSPEKKVSRKKLYTNLLPKLRSALHITVSFTTKDIPTTSPGVIDPVVISLPVKTEVQQDQVGKQHPESWFAQAA